RLDPPARAVFIARTIPAQSRNTAMPEWPFRSVFSVGTMNVYQLEASEARFWSPNVPIAPSGSSPYTMTPKIAATRSAFGVSRAVSWYSGANVAQHSMPYDGQPIT